MGNRSPPRLSQYDYASPGAYFITTCAYQRQLLFEDASIAAVISWAWKEIPLHFPHVSIDAFVVMPNHVHGIILIEDAASDVGSQHAGTPRQSAPLSIIVRSFKAAVTRELRIRGLLGSQAIWQSNYYERVIRNDAELNRIREYIAYNPIAWAHDHDNPQRTSDPDHERIWAWLEDPWGPSMAGLHVQGQRRATSTGG